MAEIHVMFGGKLVTKYIFNQGHMVVGRTRDNDIVLENLSVSRKHARLTCDDDSFVVMDLKSGNGTFVNGNRITEVELKDGDEILIGKHTLVFKNPDVNVALASDVFGAERTKLVSSVRVGALVVIKGVEVDMQFRLQKPKVTVGRGSDCDIVIQDRKMSRLQATLCRQPDGYLLKNNATWRRTKVNGTEVRQALLKQGDQIEMGNTTLMFCMTDEETLPGSPG